MLSEMACEDCEELMAEGAKLSPSEIVRLNALGCRAKLSPDASSFDALPRCAFLGDLVFREPTIAHELWLENAGRIFDRGDSLTGFALRAFAITTPYEELPDWSSAKQMQKALAKFMEKKLARFTVREVAACVRWCMIGGDWTLDEEPAKKPGEEEKGEEMSASIGVVREAQALALGISLHDAMQMTRSGLQAVILRAYRMKGIEVDKDHHNRAIGDYCATLAEVRKAHQEELNHGGD